MLLAIEANQRELPFFGIIFRSSLVASTCFTLPDQLQRDGWSEYFVEFVGSSDVCVVGEEEEGGAQRRLFTVLPLSPFHFLSKQQIISSRQEGEGLGPGHVYGYLGAHLNVNEA